MITTTLALLALTLPPQNPSKGGRLVIPKPERPAVTQPQGRGEAAPSDAATTDDAFHREALGLRRSLIHAAGELELRLARIGETFDRPAERALALARKADGDLLHGLMRIVQRFGDAAHADDLQYLLLTRPFGVAAASGVETLARLAQDGATDRLFGLLTGRQTNVRQAAEDLLLSRVTPDDLPRLLTMSRDSADDIRRRALSLLGAVPSAESRARLVEALADRSTLIGSTALRALLAHGEGAIPEFRRILSGPAVGRNFGYAALGMVTLEDQTGAELLDAATIPYLKRALDEGDPFLRTSAAIALANLAFRSDDHTGEVHADAAVVDALLLVVAPREFVDNLSLLQGPAQQKLMQLTGQDFRGRPAAWIAWWEGRRQGFVGARLALAVDPASGTKALLVWTDPARVVRVRGIDVPPLPAPQDLPVQDFVLAGDEIVALVGRLRALGFMGQGAIAAMASGEMLVAERSLELRLGDARARIAGPATKARWIDGIETEIRNLAVAEQWQLYRDPVAEPDFLAFWHAERAWLRAHPDPVERQRRLKDRIVAALPALPASHRELAVRTLRGMPGLNAMLTPQDGTALVAVAAKSKDLDAITRDLLELAVGVDGDLVWRDALAVYAQFTDQGGKQALQSAVALLGPERVRLAIAHPTREVAVAAMREAARLGDLGSTDALVRALGHDDPTHVEHAVLALGELRDGASRELLMHLAARAETPANVRRTAWVALGRIGGDGVFELLRSAVAEPNSADRLKALQALGELGTVDAADLLAQVFSAHGLDPLGTQALMSLQQVGSERARPALRRFLELRDPRLRREVVLALAEFQDPSIVPDLITLLEAPAESARVAVLLAGITGLDVPAANDRPAFVREWFRTQRTQPQGQWFLDALRKAEVATTLTAESLREGAGLEAIPELARLLPRLKSPYLRVLCGALLRSVSGEEFGKVTVRTELIELQAIADRYLFHVEARQGGRGR